MSDEGIKKYCYSVNCGPVITTGFNTNYYVCRVCKQEITERLKREIEDREAGDIIPMVIPDDEESPYGF